METLPFTLTGAVIIIIMSPVLRFDHQSKNNPLDGAQEHREYVGAGGRPSVTPLTSHEASDVYLITGAGPRRRHTTPAFVTELDG